MEANHICIIGAQRSGTSYLYKILDEHPEITFARPLRPEPKFFLDEKEFLRGREYYMNKYFSNLSEDIKFIGEKSTSYIENPVIIERINSFFPKGKIILILRNPSYRAISNYFFSKVNGIENRSIKDVFFNKIPHPTLKSTISVSPFNYIERGSYCNYIKPFKKVFKDRLEILIFEEFVENLFSIKNLYSFLEVNDNFSPASLNQIVNDSGFEPNDETVKSVICYLKEYYRPEISSLENLLERKISIWYD